MKKLLVAGSLLFLAACGTTEKSGESEETFTGDTMSVEQEVVESTPAPSAKEPEKKQTPAEAKNALNDAYKSGNDENLQRIASQNLAQNPSDTKALSALGVVSYKKGRYMAAMYYFNKALQLNPKLADVQTNVGLTQLAMGERREAIRAFKKALEIDSSEGAAAANLGSIYVLEGDYTKAVVALERAMKSGIKDSKLYNNYGIALTGTGKYEDAKDMYKDALKLDRNNRDALFNQAILLIDHLNEKSAGLEAINQLRFLGLADGMRERINTLENKAKAGSNSN